MKKLILASASARRREMLSHIGLEYTALSCDVDETSGLPNAPALAVQTLAKRKACAALELAHEPAIVVGADTIVYINGHMLTKPSDADKAREMLGELSGNVHEVYSGLCVTDGEKCICTHSMTSVKMREIGSRELEAYIATGEPFDKAGGYGIQELGGIFVEQISGDYYNVVGLPLEKLCVILGRDFSYDVFEMRRMHGVI